MRTQCYTEDVVEIYLSQRLFKVRSTERKILTHTLIVMTGKIVKRLEISDEDKF
ncbi:MAG: hypothetical protein ACTMUB_00970 [cyanobacterium endosymbiont of Rhopalodia musculus]|uniref:hypothetical protein n=1 Tax=cyanobacterium endosymbiont of Epithemia clementina EcSB TaxID=3034674 RepID=UPI00247FF296|nr:hypothetical protein [cyanobacterium endosymbiont of Epithemia clementina EcSB]WGT66840.1 hypothetical protein P3F56_06180 [cyanobacterium endosymbiont of Epithemia clementina EcSB]